MVYHWMLTIIPCAVPQNLIVWSSYILLFTLLIPSSHYFSLFPLLSFGNRESVLYVCESVL